MYKHPSMRDELEKRVKLLAKAQNNPQLQALEIELCKRDILHFFRNYLYTEANKTMFSGEESIIPFIPFPFQEEYVLEVWESIVEWNKPVSERNPEILTNIFVEKSRQMGISWITMWIFVYGFIFHKHKYTAISRTEEEVDTPWDMDSLFEKIRFMIRNLPNWMIPKDFSKELGKDKTNVFRKITDPHSEASITGKTANPDAGRWGTRHAIFMDEMAFMANATAINKSAWSNTPCRIFNSTPNGEGNEFYRMRTLCFERVDKETGKILAPEIKGLRYHWSEHPFYDTDWYNWKIKGMTPEQIAQELEIDYNTALEWRVYPEFPTQSLPIVYNPLLPLYVGIDNSHGWNNPNAIIVMQPDGVYWNIIDAIEIEQPPEYCAEFLSLKPSFQMTRQQEEFLGRWMQYNWRKAIYVSDPYDTKSAMGSSTILDDYKKNGINLMLPQNRDKQEQILKTRTNIYRIRYNDNCKDFASAIMNAKYPERKESSNSTSENNKPIHNWTSHFRTALEYLCTYLLENPLAEKKRERELPPRRDYITGKLIYAK